MSAEPKKLLIVDDSRTSNQIIRNQVRKLRSQWQIYDSDNARDALEVVAMFQPDYITMDVNMPEMSGLEAAEKIRQQWPSIRITLMTANIQDATVNRAKELNIGFIEKPISALKIAQAIAYFEMAVQNA